MSSNAKNQSSTQQTSNILDLQPTDQTADIAEKQSGAPLPNASKVTPASDSGIPNVIVIFSSAGDKYSSAVELILYMKTKSINN